MTEIPRIVVPSMIEGLPFVESFSAGKDSIATALAMKEAGISFRAVFCNVDWDDASLYEYLGEVQEVLGFKVDTVRAKWVPIDERCLEPGWSVCNDNDGPYLASPFGVFRGGMVNRILAGARFSARMQRWCTRELKIEPLRVYHDAVLAETEAESTVCVMGIRAQESAARSVLPELEFEEETAHDGRGWGGWLWRPIINWSVEQVIAMHHRHNIPVNPLYLMGHDRVGCYPCINSNKDEIRLIAERRPERIKLIAAIERMVTTMRRIRNEEHAIEEYASDVAALARGKFPWKDAAGPRPRYEHERASFFLTKRRSEDGMMPIEDVVSWSHTARGGRQALLWHAPSGGCMRWGVCEPPTTEAA